MLKWKVFPNPKKISETQKTLIVLGSVVAPVAFLAHVQDLDQPSTVKATEPSISRFGLTDVHKIQILSKRQAFPMANPTLVRSL